MLRASGRVRTAATPRAAPFAPFTAKPMGLLPTKYKFGRYVQAAVQAAARYLDEEDMLSSSTDGLRSPKSFTPPSLGPSRAPCSPIGHGFGQPSFEANDLEDALWQILHGTTSSTPSCLLPSASLSHSRPHSPAAFAYVYSNASAKRKAPEQDPQAKTLKRACTGLLSTDPPLQADLAVDTPDAMDASLEGKKNRKHKNRITKREHKRRAAAAAGDTPSTSPANAADNSSSANRTATVAEGTTLTPIVDNPFSSTSVDGTACMFAFDDANTSSPACDDASSPLAFNDAASAAASTVSGGDGAATSMMPGIKRGPRGRGSPIEGVVLTAEVLKVKQVTRTKTEGGPWGKKHSALYSKPRPYAIIAIDGNTEVKHSVESSGYTGKRGRQKAKARAAGDSGGHPLTPAELDDLGFKAYNWEPSLTHLVIDEEDRIIMVLLGEPACDDNRPPGKRWDALLRRLAEKVEAERSAHAQSFKTDHLRGNYSMLPFGLSYGGGQIKPQTLRHTKARNDIIERLKDDKDLRRIAGFQSEALASYFPLAYHHLRIAMRKLQAHDPNFTPPFINSAYPAACMNCGPTTCCEAHFDVANYPSCACAITAFGDFDADRGGHFILHDLKLYFRFPPGATILLSSAGIRHGNAAVPAGEHRYSFTQFCPGGLLRWVAYGFHAAKRFNKRERAHMDEEASEGWKQQLRRFSKVGDLQDDRAWVLEQEKYL